MEIPYILLQTILYGVITYFMIDFERTAGMVTVLFDSLNYKMSYKINKHQRIA